MVIMDSMRDSASRGLLACNVPIEPSWAGVHGLQQVEGLGSADFADDDALRRMAQAILDEIAHRDLTLSLEVGRAGFQTHHMGLLQLQFAASSHVMMRSSSSMNCVRQLSSVVLPEPVPPETMVLTRQRPSTFSIPRRLPA